MSLRLVITNTIRQKNEAASVARKVGCSLCNLHSSREARAEIENTKHASTLFQKNKNKALPKEEFGLDSQQMA